MNLKSELNKKKESIVSYQKNILKNPKKKWTFIIGFVIVLLLILVYLNLGIFLAATVNGQPITRLQLAKELEKQGGKQVLDSIITQKLIDQEAKKKGIVVSQQDLDNEIKAIESQLKAQGTDLDTALAFQGQTRAQLQDSLKLKIQVEKLIADKISISEEEITTYFNENKTSFVENAKLEDVKSQITETIRQTKLSQEYQTWLQELKSISKINYLINF